MTLDVTVEESKEKDERSTAILIHGYSPNGQRGNLQLNIFQAGIGGDDPDPGTNPDVQTVDTLFFDGDGGSIDVVYHVTDPDFNPENPWFTGIRGKGKLKDASDPMNPIYTITVSDSWRLREDAIFLKSPRSPFDLDGSEQKTYRKWIIKQTGKTKKDLKWDNNKVEETFLQVYSIKREPVLGRTSTHHWSPGVEYDPNYYDPNPSITFTAMGEGRYQFVWESERNQLDNQIMKLVLFLDQDDNGLYLESGTIQYNCWSESYSNVFEATIDSCKERNSESSSGFYFNIEEDGQNAILDISCHINGSGTYKIDNKTETYETSSGSSIHITIPCVKIE
jgi:hypothetical protein